MTAGKMIWLNDGRQNDCRRKCFRQNDALPLISAILDGLKITCSELFVSFFVDIQ